MRTLKILVLWLALAAPAFAQNDQTLSVTGEVATPLTLTRQESIDISIGHDPGEGSR